MKLEASLVRRGLSALGVVLALATVPACAVDAETEDEASAQLSDALVTTGLPFGPMQLPEDQYGQRFNFSHESMWPGADKGYLTEVLATARAGKTALSIQLTPNRRFMYIDNGCSDPRTGRRWDCGFDFDKWKQYMDRFKGMDLSGFVRDGTLLVHYIVDEPFCASCWDGKTIPPEDIERAAKYSKTLFPYLPTVIRVAPSLMAGKGMPSVDAAWAQYVVPAKITTEAGVAADASAYVAREVNLAKDQGRGLIFSLNVINGGIRGNDCTIDLGTQDGRCSMSKATLLAVGEKMLRTDYACAVGMWSASAAFNGDTYFARSDIRAAVDTTLKPLARSRAARACRR